MRQSASRASFDVKSNRVNYFAGVDEISCVENALLDLGHLSATAKVGVRDREVREH